MVIYPLLAATANKEADIPSFPLLATPKIDGVRALIVNGQLVSRTLKPIPNKIIRSALECLLPEGADGEIYCGNLYTTTSTVMSFDKVHMFEFYWFDWAYDVNAPYIERVSAINTFVSNNLTASYSKAQQSCRMPLNGIVVPLIPRTINSMGELYEYEKQVLDKGLEGVMLRTPSGIYKSGRSTLAEGIMVKLKRHIDSEAIIVGTEELMHKQQAGNTLGAIVAKTHDGTVFKIGTGYTADQRLALWVNRDIIIGKAVKYKYESGKNKPRCSVFMGIRHEDDM